MKTALDSLQENLNELERAKKKSETAFNEGGIGWLEHEKHLTNLEPQIRDYKFAIRILKDNLE